MTTEVLRNMLLAGSDLLARLETVILDEVHYLQDPYRGGVWEEVLVLSRAERAPSCACRPRCPTPTSSASWLRSVRGPVEVVVEQRRPITLRHHFAVHRRSDDDLGRWRRCSRHGAASDEALRIDQAVRRAGRTRCPRSMGPAGPAAPDAPAGPLAPAPRGGRAAGGRGAAAGHRLHLQPGRLRRRGAPVPARRGPAHHPGRARRRSGPSPSATWSRSPTTTSAVLGYPEWLEGLESGLAAHHAGLVPAYRETVEECFAGGLLKVVFATETLSLGINMPARTVVIERFTKFGGAGRATLTSGEYAQLTGRAGRRGHDAEGHAVVLFSPETPLAEAARVALAPPPDLRSTFRPTYNLAVNLVRRFDRETAHGVLRSSFAQWQAHGIPSAGPELLTEALGRRLAVLEELGYVRRLVAHRRRDAGSRPCTTSPTSWSPRPSRATSSRAPSRRSWPGSSRPSSSRSAGPARSLGRAAAPGSATAAQRPGASRPSDRLGERRRQELAERLGRLSGALRADPGPGGGPHGAADRPARARAGHRGGRLGPGGVVRGHARGGGPRRGGDGAGRLRAHRPPAGRPGPPGRASWPRTPTWPRRPRPPTISCSETSWRPGRCPHPPSREGVSP